MIRPTLRQIGTAFLRHGNWTFGGGSATLAVLQTELIERKLWVDRETFSLSFGLARLTPGTNLLSFGVGIGWLLRGINGAIVALLTGSIPCSLIALIVTALYQTWNRNRFVQIGLHGALAAAVGVMIATGWALIRPFWKGLPLLRLAVFTGGAVGLALYGLSPIKVLFLAAFVGLLWPERKRSELVCSVSLPSEGHRHCV
jgi:chromate transporter